MLTNSRNEARSAAHTRSRRGIALVGAVVAFCLLSGCIENDQASALSALRSDRSHNSVRTISLDASAGKSAQAHAAGMATRHSLYHTTLHLGPGQCGMGENVGFGSSVAQVERAFMNSAKHRANILNGTFDHVGLGVTRSGGQVWVVQLFIDYC